MRGLRLLISNRRYKTTRQEPSSVLNSLELLILLVRFISILPLTHYASPRDMQYAHHAERRICDLKNEILEEHRVTFVDAVIRAATAINSNVNEQSVRNAIEHNSLSWTDIVNQRKVITTGQFSAIGHLDEDQCDKLFDIIDGMIPKGWRQQRQILVDTMKFIFYEKWLMKCM